MVYVLGSMRARVPKLGRFLFVWETVSMYRMTLVFLLMTGTLTMAGCGGVSSGPVDEPLRLALEDFAQFLKNLPSDGFKPPKKMAEFTPLEPMAPVASEYIQNGQLIYFWGADLVEGGQRIIAHQKGAEASGGWALLESGEVVMMTAEDFSAAAKAGP
jgi:hypothetical protein